MIIDHINLSRFDLNLLVALDALLTERSVTRAALRVGLRQSAMSHNLARLRKLLGDELLIRGPAGMQPTPRALALIEPVRTSLAQITTLLSHDESFDPGTAERLFRIGLPDSAEVLFGPTLLTHLCAAAPGLRLRFYPTDGVFEALDADRLDLGIIFGRSRKADPITSGARWAATAISACSTPSGSASRRRSLSRTICGCPMCSPIRARASRGWWTKRWPPEGCGEGSC